MIEFLIDNISSILTIIGFIATFLITKYSCKREIEKLRKEKMMEKIEDIPMKLMNVMYEIQKSKNDSTVIKKSSEKLVEIMHTILAYCGNDSVKIASYIQQGAYTNSFKNWEILCSYSILVSQLKYDLTGEYVSPEFYFKIKITDYSSKMRAQVKFDNNKIVKQLKLSEKLLIK